jgi:hypothetical protein
VGRKRVSLNTFRRQYNGMSVDDEELAETIVMGLLESEPLHAAAKKFLNASEEFAAALAEAKIERG